MILHESLAKRRCLRLGSVALAPRFGFQGLLFARALIVSSESIVQFEAGIHRADLDTLADLPFTRVGVVIQCLEDFAVSRELMLRALYGELATDPIRFLLCEGEIHAFHEVEEDTQPDKSLFLYLQSRFDIIYLHRWFPAHSSNFA